MHLLDKILETYRPDILCMCEANLTPDFMKHMNKYSEYIFEVTKMYHSIGTSRNILMIRNNISYIRRYDLEDDILSTIWIELNLKKNQKLLLCVLIVSGVFHS